MERTQNISVRFTLFLLIVSVLLVTIYQWVFLLPQNDTLIYDVPQTVRLGIFETPNLYLIVNFFTLLFPFMLSFDKKVGFYKKWKVFVPACFLVGAFFITWDIYFTANHVWGFNPKYYNEYLKLLGLPLPEWMFFITVPYACVFIYECLKSYIKRPPLLKWDKPISVFTIVTFVFLGVLTWGKVYTSSTFLLSGVFLLLHYIYGVKETRSWFYLMYLISWIPFILVDGILTGTTTVEPIVLYNPEGFTDVRILSVPIEDSIYSFLLLLMNITLIDLFEKKRSFNSQK